MSTATLEPPSTKTAGQTAAELPPLSDAFAAAMKGQSVETATPEPVKEAAKEPMKEKEGATAEVAKTEVAKVDPTKKRSALDAALADDVVTTELVKDDVEQLIESKDPNWDKARPVMKRQSEEIKTLKEQLSKAGAPAPELTAKLTTLEKRAAELETENSKLRDGIMAVDYRYDPATQEKIAARDNSVSKLAASVKDAGADADTFLDVMSLPLAKRGKAIDAILESIESGRTRAIIERKLAEVEVMDEYMEEQLSKPTKSFEELKRSREVAAQEHTQKMEAFKTATYEKVQSQLPKLSKFMRLAPEDAEGAADYNTQLKADMEKAPKLLNVSPEEATVLTFKAARYDSLEKIATDRFSKDGARIAELEATLAKFEGAEPGFRGGGKATPKADYERPIGDVFAEALRKPEI